MSRCVSNNLKKIDFTGQASVCEQLNKNTIEEYINEDVYVLHEEEQQQEQERKLQQMTDRNSC